MLCRLFKKTFEFYYHCVKKSDGEVLNERVTRQMVQMGSGSTHFHTFLY